MDAQQFGAFISKKRKDNNLTQKELAEKLMVTDKAISRWENGHGFPDIETLEPLAKATQILFMACGRFFCRYYSAECGINS